MTTDHLLIINVPKGDNLLSFDLTSENNKTFRDGTTIKIPISISNFQSKREYDNLNDYINKHKFEIEFICNNTSKKFTLKFLIEKAFAEDKIRYLSVPYFIHKGNDFIKLDGTNYGDLIRNNIYFNYEELNVVKKNDNYKIKKIR